MRMITAGKFTGTRLRSTILLIIAGLVAIFAVVYDPDAPAMGDLSLLEPYSEHFQVERVLEKIESTSKGAEKGFSFVVWGDFRSNRPVFEQLWSEIQKENAVFAVATGDFVRRGFVDEWLEYCLPVLDRFYQVPFLPVIGNHDVGHNRVEYKRIFGLTDYAFEYGNTQFIITDNLNGYSRRKLQWMEKQLSTSKTRFKFVFAHKPPKTIAKWAYHSFDQGADAFCGLLTRYRVTAAFFGHIHAYSTARYNGVLYVVTAGGGAPLNTRYGPMGNVHHYCVVHVTPEGVTHEVVRLIEDEFWRSPEGNEYYRSPARALPALIPGVNLSGRETMEFSFPTPDQRNSLDPVSNP